MTEPTAPHDPADSDPGGSAPARGELVEDRYRLLSPVGGGLTATVWRAQDEVLGREVEVKLWRDSSVAARSSQSEELAELRSADPSLVGLLDAGLHRGRPFVVRDRQTDPPAAAAEDPHREPETRDATPPAGYPRPPAPWGERVVGLTVAAILLAVVVVAWAILFRPSDDGDGAGGPTEPPPSQRVAYSPSTFDPEGDGDENPREIGAVADDNAATEWSTDRYSNRAFGNLKSGVGVVLRLDPARAVGRVEVHTTSTGWSAQVHAAPAPGATLADWGAPVATRSGAGVSEAFDLPGSSVGAVLVWFTDLGEANRLSVTEIVLLGR